MFQDLSAILCPISKRFNLAKVLELFLISNFNINVSNFSCRISHRARD